MTVYTITRRAVLAAALVSASHGSAAFAQAAAQPGAADASGEIIVTGTRATGLTAAESATPIKLLSEEAIQHVGQPNLNQVLTQLVPSFTAQAFGGDTANLTLSAKLRGLSPNHTLVLVNGKRRHGTANLAVLGGPYQGAAAPDLDLISPNSIKRIEVLEDGAAAQYGSDAIAGVINIILKDDAEGLDGYGTAGANYDVGGTTYAGAAHLATKLGDSGFVNVTIFHRYVDHTISGGKDRRVTDINGNLLTTTTNPSLSAAQQALYRNIPGFPYVNLINGNARSHLTNAQFNAGYDFGTVKAYAFGTYSKRIASAYENFRVPDRIIASPVLGVGGTLGAPGSIVYDPDGDNPSNGFNPKEGIREDDFSGTAGLKGEVMGFRWDLSTTYGQDKNKIYTLDSANRSLFIDTHFTPTTFYDGYFRSTEWTSNLDLAREFDVGMAGPMNVAFGAEYRRNTYQIGSGDPGSIYKEGGQSYPGFRPSDAGFHKRSNESVYLDVALNPLEGLKADGAVRYEHYSDFGSRVIFKGTSRYDFNPMFAVRGTVSTGFRAPTLAESYYSATNVGPTTAFVQLPANSAAAKVLGFQNLKPEKSLNFSAGTVIRPTSRLTLTLDAYQIRIRDRILGTGTLYSAGGGNNAAGQNLNFPLVRTAIVTNGNVLDPTVTQTGINVFTNGATTRTRGVDVTANYTMPLGNLGNVTWTLSGNYNKTKILRYDNAPPLVNTAGQTVVIPLFDTGARSNLETASPHFKIIAGAFWTWDRLSVTARETIYGKSSQQQSPDGGTFYKQTIGTAGITDLEVSYKLTNFLTISGGANNLFNKKPPIVPLVPGTTNQTLVNGGNLLDARQTFSPYGINGGYYYTRFNVSF